METLIQEFFLLCLKPLRDRTWEMDLCETCRFQTGYFVRSSYGWFWDCILMSVISWILGQLLSQTWFQVKRPGDKNVRCTILLLLDYQPLQFKLDQRLARLLGVHTQTRPVIISALWQYIKTHKLQDPHEREYVNCDPFLRQIFQADRMKFAEIPQRLNPLLHPPG